MLSENLKDAMSRWASGVAVAASEHDSHVYGLTVSSFTSVSLDPPLILICIGKQNRLPQMIGSSGRFGISLLDDGQGKLAAKFAAKKRAPLAMSDAESYFSRLESGVPILKEASAGLMCRLYDMHGVGDHDLVIGEVTDVVLHNRKEPLVYYRRSFGTFLSASTV